MASTLKKLGQGQLAASDGALYTVPAGTTTVLTLLVLCNTDTSTMTVRIHQVDSAGSSSASNALYYDYAIAAGRTFVPPLSGMVGQAGQMIRGLASSASKVTYALFGIERV
jgi:hypothetical protein